MLDFTGGLMKRILLHLVSAGMFLSLATLTFPGPVRGQSDVDKVFKTSCVLCHAADGSGSSPTGKTLKAKDLRSDEVQKKTDAELAQIIAKGVAKMPAFEKKLKAEDITKLVAYIRALPKDK
jgi:mono/diheme cytochrome c family protein